jgi:hypothetical protein
MKLALSFPMLFTSTALLLLSGCKPKTSIEQFVVNSKSKPTIHVVFEYGVDGAKQTADVLIGRTKDHARQRMMASTATFKLRVNEVDGSLEYDQAEREYAEIPPLGKFYAGTGQIFPVIVTTPNPLLGESPEMVAPLAKWKKTEKSDLEVWKTSTETLDGMVEYEFAVDKMGAPKFYRAGRILYTVKSFELLDKNSIESYKLEIPDGYEPFSKPFQEMMLQVGAPWQETYGKNLVGRGKFHNYAPAGATLYALVDPKDPLCQKASRWLASTNVQYTKVPVVPGEAPDSLCDLKSEWVYKWANGLPMFVLTNKAGVIIGLWMGFDSATVGTMEKEIRERLLENS